MEKGGTFRHFVTSPRLKEAIAAAHLVRLRALAAEGNDSLSDIYVFSGTTEPVSPSTVTCWLRKLAAAAGVTEVLVSAHPFRHTIVGRLMDAGNSLEVTSKYMGHKSLDTTSTHYWVADAQQLHENLNNPMTGAFQEKVRDEDLRDKELEVQRKKTSKAMEIIGKTLGALDEVRKAGGSADDVAEKIKEAIPNLAKVLHILGEDEA